MGRQFSKHDERCDCIRCYCVRVEKKRGLPEWNKTEQPKESEKKPVTIRR